MMNPLMDYKAVIENEVGESVSDFVLNLAWEEVKREVGYDPLISLRKEHLEGTGTDKLYLRYRPVQSLEKLSINGSEVKNVSEISIIDNRYIKLNTKQDYKGYEMRDVLAEHEITDEIYCEYFAGYDVIPLQLILASIFFIKFVTSEFSGEGNLTQYKIDTISYTFKSSQTNYNTFKNYIREVIGFWD